MKKQGITLLALALAAVLGMSGCGKGTQTTGEAAEPSLGTEVQDTEKKDGAAEEPVEKDTESGEASKKDSKAGDTIILTVSFGTSYNDSREKTIGAIEDAIGNAWQEYEVRRAFTAQMIIDKLKARDGISIDNVTEALDRAAKDNAATLVVQPTHLMNGLEYQDLMTELKEYEAYFERIVVGEPLLTSDEDFQAVAKAITDATGSYDDGETAIVFMGHGSEAESNQVYEKMQAVLYAEGFKNYYIGTVEAKPDLEDVLAALKEAGSYKRVVLAPLMVVFGDHASNDMAGDEEDSWKSVLTREGYEVDCFLQGLGELKAIQDIYVEHVNAALEELGLSEPKSRSVSIDGRDLAWSHSMELKYAEEFSIDYYEGGYVWITVGDSDCFLVVPKEGTVPENPREGVTVLKQPIENIYLSASAVMDMFISMDGMDRLRFSSMKEDGWYIKEAQEAMEAGRLLYAGKYAAPDYERLLSEDCGLAIENTMIYHTPQVKEQLERLGIPVIVDHSSYEKEPLVRMEWIRLYGLLAGKDKEAEDGFLAQAEAFEKVTAQVKEKGTEKKPRAAFFYITSNGQVNIRKPSDYLSQMIELAGGSYVFEGQDDGNRSSTMTIQMEEFYAWAKEADYLIYNSTVDGELQGMGDLLEKDGIFKNFKAVKEGNVFCTTKDLYQSSMALGTIIFDLHEMLEGREENLTYFYRLKSLGKQAEDYGK